MTSGMVFRPLALMSRRTSLWESEVPPHIGCTAAGL